MTDRTLSVEALAEEVAEHLAETDAPYVAEVGSRVLGLDYAASADGENVVHGDVSRSVGSLVAEIADRISGMDAKEAAAIAGGLLSGTYEAGPDGLVQHTFAPDAPAP